MLASLVALAMNQDPPLKGDHIAPFTAVEVSGDVYEWKPGRVTVLCAFAYWCDTWKTQCQRLMDARGKSVGLPVDFIAISVDGQWLEVDKKANWSRKMVDVGSRWSKSLGIDRVPYTLVIDESGTVEWAGYGISRSEDIMREVRSAMSHTDRDANTVYLTFDDFPAKSNNAELLDTLRRLQVHASFFVIGESAEKDSKWLSRAIDDGNRLEVHGWRHTAEDSDPEQCRKWIEHETGQNPKWVRAPGSSIVQDFSGHKFISPDIDPYDFLRPGAAELKRRVFGRMKAGSILHLHAGVKDTIDALPDIIERGLKLGFRFEALP